MLGIFGGAFDPPHLGHLWAVTYALAMDERITEVVVVPSLRHPTKPAMRAAFGHRVAMAQMLFKPLGSVVYVNSLVELGIARHEPDPVETPIYTVEVVEHYRALTAHICLILGQDEATDLPHWHRYSDLCRLTEAPSVVPRGPFDGTCISGSSSTKVRRYLAANRFEDAAIFVPQRILTYIAENDLYTTAEGHR